MSDPIMGFLDLNKIHPTGKYVATESDIGKASPINPTVSVEQINQAIETRRKTGASSGEVSDGYHTFNELYHHRAILFATICNNPLLRELAWKSKQHNDPNEPMYDGMFIVGIETPDGQATYHYDIDPYWDMFHCKELERAPEYDGHTPDEAIKRIQSLWRTYIK